MSAEICSGHLICVYLVVHHQQYMFSCLVLVSYCRNIDFLTSFLNDLASKVTDLGRSLATMLIIRDRVGYLHREGGHGVL